MSGVLSALNAVGSWRNRLLPGSFRGVPFYIDQHDVTGGRRIVQHEFPLRDVAQNEDLGKVPRKFRVPAWVIGDDYMDQRDALIAACENYNTPGTLIHPYFGSVLCRAGALRTKESIDRGGAAYFDIEFYREDPVTSPAATQNTASTLLSGLISLAGTISSAYQLVQTALTDPAALLSLGGDLLGGAVGSFLNLDPTTIAGLGSIISAIASAPLDFTNTPIYVAAAFQDAVVNALAAQATTSTPTDPLSGDAFDLPPTADLTGGIASLGTWGNDLSTPSAFGAPLADQATYQAGVIALIQGNATLATLQIYAQTDFSTATAATNARATALALTDAQAQAASDAGQDDLFRAWTLIGAQAQLDMITRAQALPNLTSYALGASLPWLTLAQRFYQDASRGDELVSLNDAPAPLFMPPAGVRLSA